MRITANYFCTYNSYTAKFPNEYKEVKQSPTFQAKISIRNTDNPVCKKVAAKISQTITPPKSKSWRVIGRNLVDEKGRIDPIKGFFVSDISKLNEETLYNLKSQGCEDIGLGVSFNDGDWLWGDLPIENAKNGYILKPEETLEQLYKKVDMCLEAGLKRIIIICDDPLLHTQEAKKFFGIVSEKYRDKPNIFYEICAEAGNPGGKLGYEPTLDHVSNYANEVIPVIRNNNPESVIIVGPNGNGQNIPEKNPFREGHIMIIAHPYMAEDGSPEVLKKVKKAYNKGICTLIQCGTSIAERSNEEIIRKSRGWMKFMKKKVGGILYCYLGNSEFASDALKAGSKFENLNFREPVRRILEYTGIIKPTKKVKSAVQHN